MSYKIPLLIKYAIERHRAELAAAINDAVQVSFEHAREECVTEPGEVDKVLQFFIDGVGEIERRFNAILQPDDVVVSIASIFTHQTPYVRFSTSAAPNARCEMADLCILATYGIKLDPADGIGNAVFLQAKETFDAPPADRQRQLYEVAHQFRYDNPVSLRAILPDERHLPGKDEDALSYWEFGPAQTFLRWSHHPEAQLNFGEAIIHFLTGDSGYGFRAPRANEKSWSRIIFDLLTVTARACANRRNLKVRGRERGAGRIYRTLFEALGEDPTIPFVVRNSLRKILSNYGEELEKLGHVIEQTPGVSEEKIDRLTASTPSGSDHEPPTLGNNLDYDGDGNGGAGNFMLIEFNRRR